MWKKQKAFKLLVLFSVICSFAPVISWASEGNSEKSASVKTEGAITFIGTTDSSTEPPDDSSTEPSSDSSTDPTTEPSSSTVPSGKVPDSSTASGGKLPNTGEENQNWAMVGGSGFLLLALVVFFWKRRAADRGKGGMGR